MAGTPPQLPFHAVDLVLEGGGVRGPAHVGAIQALMDLGITEFPRICGTSAGSLVGSLVAAGWKPQELRALMDATDFRDFTANTLLSGIPVVGGLLSILFRHGEHTTNRLEAFMAEHLAARGVRTYRDLPLLADPGADPVLQDRRVRFIAIVADLTRHRQVRVPWDLHEMGIDAMGYSVARSVNISSSYPPYYVPVYERDLASGQTSELVDGGITGGLQVGVFDRTDGLPPRWPTLNLSLAHHVLPSEKVNTARDIPTWVGNIIGTATEGRDLDLADDRYNRVIWLNADFVDPADYTIGRDVKERLYQAGYDAVMAWAKTFDWQHYVAAAARFRVPPPAAAAPQSQRAPRTL